MILIRRHWWPDRTREPPPMHRPRTRPTDGKGYATSAAGEAAASPAAEVGFRGAVGHSNNTARRLALCPDGRLVGISCRIRVAEQAGPLARADQRRLAVRSAGGRAPGGL